jgi:hypothetical protein
MGRWKKSVSGNKWTGGEKEVKTNEEKIVDH